MNLRSPIPPRGWNSYDGYSCGITEADFRTNVDAIAAKLLPHGYTYACIDAGWYYDAVTPNNLAATSNLKPHLDEFGRLLPSPKRFPSAGNGLGFKPLAEYVHAHGLKFGLHLMRGVPRWAAERRLPIKGTKRHAGEIADPSRVCAWEYTMYGVDMAKEGAQAWYDRVVALCAEWGVDFIKGDDFLNPYHRDEIAGLRRAVDGCGRPMVLSLSPGIECHEILKSHAHVAAHADMWRISADIWDKWEDVRHLFHLCAVWGGALGSGGWPDADMLPYGMMGLGNADMRPTRKSRLTEEEVRTHFTLLAIARSPLILGGDVSQLDEFTLGIVTHPEVLAVNEKSRNNRQVWTWPRDDRSPAWRADTEDGAGRYVALFNLGETMAEVRLGLGECGLGDRARIRDLWARRDLGVIEKHLIRPLAPHACGLYRLEPA